MVYSVGLLVFFMWSDFEKPLSHFEQLKVFSSVWVLSCSFKELDVEQTCHTLCTWIEFLLSGSSHGFQVTWCKEEVRFREALVTLRAFERFLPCVGPLMLLQGTWCWKHLSHFAPLPHLNLSWVDPLMGFQVTWCKEALVTLCALEWLFSHVGSLMFLQVASYWATLVALWSFKNHPVWVLSFLYCLSEKPRWDFF